MKIILNPSINEIISDLNKNKLVIIPTDTIYGLACKFDDDKNKVRIYEIKKRPTHKPLSLIVSSLNMANDIMVLNDDIIDKLSASESVTVIGELRDKSKIDSKTSINTIALRITKAKWLQDVIEQTGPILATSVNISNDPPSTNLADLRKFDVDTIFYNGELGVKASPIYDSFKKSFIRN